MFGLPFFHVRESWTRQKIAIEKLLKNVPKMQMAVVRVLVLIQVGGKADGAADAAPSPSRFALGRRSQAHAQTDKADKRKSKAATARAFAADPLGESPAYSVAPCLDFYRYAFCYVTFGSSFITSGLTCPIYSPSIQHPKLSKRSIFLSSKP